MVAASKDNQVTIRRKGKAYNMVKLDTYLPKWLFENRDKTLEKKLTQKNEKTLQSLQSRHDTEVSEITTEEFDNSTLRELLSQIELVCKRLNSLENNVRMIGEKSGASATKYRKNRRVMYIPKTGIYEEVLKRLRKHENEELKITIEKVFQIAAQQLGIIK